MKKTVSAKRLKSDPFLSEVIVDILFEEGLFFIAVINLSYRPVFKVNIKFNKQIIGLNGDKVISDLLLFRNIEFLAPRKEIKTFIDTSESYFRRKQPTKITAAISYINSEAKQVTGTIHHDIEIYQELGYIKKNSWEKVKIINREN